MAFVCDLKEVFSDVFWREYVEYAGQRSRSGAAKKKVSLQRDLLSARSQTLHVREWAHVRQDAPEERRILYHPF